MKHCWFSLPDSTLPVSVPAPPPRWVTPPLYVATAEASARQVQAFLVTTEASPPPLKAEIQKQFSITITTVLSLMIKSSVGNQNTEYSK